MKNILLFILIVISSSVTASVKINGINSNLDVSFTYIWNEKNTSYTTKVDSIKPRDGKVRIAYVDVDAIMEQYDLCIEYKNLLESRRKKIEKELAAEQLSLENEAHIFQNKLQNNGFTNREEEEKQQASLMRVIQKYKETEQRLQGELQKQTEEYNKALHDSIQHFLAEYNKVKKYSMILAKQGDIILLPENALDDITEEVVIGLNWRYRSKGDSNPDVYNNIEPKDETMTIAYIELDTIMEQYDFCKEYKTILENKSKKVDDTLNAMQQSLEKNAQAFLNKLQNNGFTSRDEVEKLQASVKRDLQKYEETAQQLQGELQKQTEEYNKALQDSIQHFLAEYNKEKKYSKILTKQCDNILIADKNLDITDEFVIGLNRRYRAKGKSNPVTH